jgi:hypothetical protein
VHPFSDTTGVDHVLKDAENIFSENSDRVGPKNAARIWGFISKFVMVDRFIKALGVADTYPGLPMPRKLCTGDYLGNGSKARFFLLNYLTLLNKI